MYGLLIESIIDFVKRRYGSTVWEKVRKRAKIDNYSFSTHQQYSETLFLKTIKVLSEIVGEFIFFFINHFIIITTIIAK